MVKQLLWGHYSLLFSFAFCNCYSFPFHIDKLYPSLNIPPETVVLQCEDIFWLSKRFTAAVRVKKTGARSANIHSCGCPRAVAFGATCKGFRCDVPPKETRCMLTLKRHTRASALKWAVTRLSTQADVSEGSECARPTLFTSTLMSQRPPQPWIGRADHPA